MEKMKSIESVFGRILQVNLRYYIIDPECSITAQNLILINVSDGQKIM